MAKKKAADAKRAAVAKRIKEISQSAEILVGMWDERTLDFLILILGIGHVAIGDPGGDES